MMIKSDVLFHSDPGLSMNTAPVKDWCLFRIGHLPAKSFPNCIPQRRPESSNGTSRRENSHEFLDALFLQNIFILSRFKASEILKRLANSETRVLQLFLGRMSKASERSSVYRYVDKFVVYVSVVKFVGRRHFPSPESSQNFELELPMWTQTFLLMGKTKCFYFWNVFWIWLIRLNVCLCLVHMFCFLIWRWISRTLQALASRTQDTTTWFGCPDIRPNLKQTWQTEWQYMTMNDT